MRVLYIVLMLCCVGLFLENAAGETTLVSKEISASAPALEGHQLPQTIPVKRRVESRDDEISVTTKLVLCIGLLVMTTMYFYYSKKMGKDFLSFIKKGEPSLAKNKAQLKLSKQIALTDKHSLHLVAWDGEELLIGCTDQTITVIARKMIIENLSQIQVVTADKENKESCSTT